MDQAGTLRKLMHNRAPVKQISTKSIRVISVTSGKGGVGKTNIVANMAYHLQKAGKKVLVLDGDFGLANLNIVMGLEPRGTITDVISGAKDLSDIAIKGPQGLMLLPSSSGIFRMSSLTLADKSILMDRLENSDLPFDTLIIDTGAGINSDVLYLNAAAHDVVVVSTPEPTSIADAYALMKVMSQQYKLKKFKLLVNMVSDEKEALNVYNSLLAVADQFLNISIEYLGFVPFDRKVSQSVMGRKLFSEKYPNSPATLGINEVANTLVDLEEPRPVFTGNLNFFWKTLISNEVSI